MGARAHEKGYRGKSDHRLKYTWPGARVKVQAHKSIGVRTEEQCHKGNGTEIKGKVTVAKSKTQK